MKKKKTEIVIEDNNIEQGAVTDVSAHVSFNEQGTKDTKEKGVQIAIDDVVTESKVKTESNDKLMSDQKQQLDQAADVVTKQKSKKKKWTSLIFMLINIGIVVGIVLSQIKSDNMVPLSEVIADGVNWWFFALLIAVFALIQLCESLKIEIFLRNSTKKRNWGLSYKVSALGRYYDCITPMAAGGQPFQMYYMSKRGISGANSVAVTMGKYAFSQTAWVLISTVVIFASIATTGQGGVGQAVVSAASWIGYIASCGVVFLIALVSINRKVGTRFVGWFIKIGHKIKIVKDYEKTYNKVIKAVDDFQGTIKYYLKSPKTFIIAIVTAIANLLLIYSIPFFIYCAFAGYESGIWWDIFMKSVMIDLAACFIPLPGGSGAAELSFTTLFGSLFVDGKLFWALLLWRIFSYYGYIFQGLGVIIYDYAIGDKKHQWKTKRNQLVLESEKFKAEQMSVFKHRKQKNKTK